MTNEANTLQQELHALRQLATDTLIASADLGFVVQFLIESFTLPDYSSLAEALIKALKAQGLDASVSLKSYSERLFFDSTGNEDKADQDTLHAQIKKGRIVEVNNTLQINYPRVSIFIRNFDCDELRRGQLRDALSLLLEGVEARIRSLVLADKEAEAQYSKKEFFALMSHELRTPLSPIIGFSTRLEKKVGESIDAKHKTAISSIKNNAESLLRLLNYFIDFCRLEADDIYIEHQTIDLKTLTDKALNIAAPIIEGYNNKISQQIPDGISLHVDPARFTEIVVSLVCNAARISRGQEISIAAELDDPAEIHLSVKGNGTLADEASKDALFECLKQRNMGNMNKANELGIGLYLTKKLIELHGGRIELSTEGGGNTFHVYLPRKTGG